MAELPLVSPLDRALFLRAQPYLAGVDSSVIVALAEHSVERFFRRGEWLYPEHGPIRSIFFLSQGSVAAMRAGRRLLEITSPGGTGLAHVLARSPDPPGCRALSDSVCLEIALSSYLRLLEDRFPLVLQMAQVLSRLLGEAEAELGLAETSESKPDAAASAAAKSLDLVERIALARHSGFFRETNLTVLAELLHGGSARALAPDEALRPAGERAETLGLVEAGSLRATGRAGARWIGPGAVTGIQDLFSGLPAEEKLVAGPEGAVVLEIPRALYVDALEDHFDLSCELLAHLARRYVALRMPADAPASDQPASSA